MVEVALVEVGLVEVGLVEVGLVEVGLGQPSARAHGKPARSKGEADCGSNLRVVLEGRMEVANV